MPLRGRKFFTRVDAGGLDDADAAKLGGVSERTAFKWLSRWRDGDRQLEDRPSITHRCPHQASLKLVERTALLRGQRRTTPQLAFHPRLPRSMVGAVCRRPGMGRPGLATPPDPPNRYQRRHPGERTRLDINKLGRIGRPGHRVNGDRTTRTPGIG